MKVLNELKEVFIVGKEIATYNLIIFFLLNT